MRRPWRSSTTASASDPSGTCCTSVPPALGRPTSRTCAQSSKQASTCVKTTSRFSPTRQTPANDPTQYRHRNQAVHPQLGIQRVEVGEGVGQILDPLELEDT